MTEPIIRTGTMVGVEWGEGGGGDTKITTIQEQRGEGVVVTPPATHGPHTYLRAHTDKRSAANGCPGHVETSSIFIFPIDRTTHSHYRPRSLNPLYRN